MHKLDKIDETELYQKSSDLIIHDMVSNLQSGLEHIKTLTIKTKFVHTPRYADVVNTPKNSRKMTQNIPT